MYSYCTRAEDVRAAALFNRQSGCTTAYRLPPINQLGRPAFWRMTLAIVIEKGTCCSKVVGALTVHWCLGARVPVGWYCCHQNTVDQVWHRDARRARAARRYLAFSLARNLPGVQVVHGGVFPILGHLVAGERGRASLRGEMYAIDRRCLWFVVGVFPSRVGKKSGLLVSFSRLSSTHCSSTAVYRSDIALFGMLKYRSLVTAFANLSSLWRAPRPSVCRCIYIHYHRPPPAHPPTPFLSPVLFAVSFS